MRVGGVRLGIRRWGREHDGPALLLLHSLGEHSGSWHSVAEGLSRSHHVLALDLRGHGESQTAPAYTLELLRDDVFAVIDHLGLTDVCIVGHSLGGMVAYLTAMSGDRRITRLVLEEAPPPLPLDPPREIPEDPGEDYGFDWKALTHLYAVRNRPDPQWWDKLLRVEVPVLVLAGGPSSHVDQAQLRAMTERLPNARLLSIDAGHNIHAEAPKDRP